MGADRLEALKERCREHARTLGFALCGFTSPQPPPGIETYLEWVAAGRQGGMSYLATERAIAARRDPCLLLPGCKTVLVVAAPYPPAESPDPGPLGGRVAAYAMGDDYHDVLPPRLEMLVRFLQAEVGGRIAHRLYTDTGPLLERALARRAGLGWIGKNSMLIHPRLGSYLLLAEVLLDLELPPDAPFREDRCGTCRRCLEACPSGCILPDRTLEAGRCLAYLTIEHRGQVPLSLRQVIGNWVFGCDLCQEACPWNARTPGTNGPPVADGPPEFKARPHFPIRDLGRVLEASESGLSSLLQHSPLRRAKRQGLRRNAAIVLGNSCRPEAIPVLARTMEEAREAVVRALAAWALGQIGTPIASQHLRVALESERDAGVRSAIESALGPSPFVDPGTGSA